MKILYTTLYSTIHNIVVLHIHRRQKEVWTSIALFGPCRLRNSQQAQMSPSHSLFWRRLPQQGVHWHDARWGPSEWNLKTSCCLQNKLSALQSRSKESEQDYGNSMLLTILFPSSIYTINPACTCIAQLSCVPRAGALTRQERGHAHGSPLQRQNCVEDKVTATLNTKMSLRAHETVLYVNLDMAIIIFKNAVTVVFSFLSAERQVALSLKEGHLPTYCISSFVFTRRSSSSSTLSFPFGNSLAH